MSSRKSGGVLVGGLGVMVVGVVLGALSGCESVGASGSEEAREPVVQRAAPSYAEVVKLHHDRIVELSKIRASVNVRLRYRDEDGRMREEQPEGILQVHRPDKLALSLGKAGQKLYWFGCDQARFWWFDFNEGRRAKVGARTAGGEVARQRLGVNLSPWDLVHLLGIVELPADAPAETSVAWSEDFRWIVVRVPIEAAERPKSGVESGPAPDGGRSMVEGSAAGSGAPADGALEEPRLFRELSIEPRDGFVARVRILDHQGRAIVAAELEGDERVEIKREGFGSARPRMPSTITIQPEGSEAQIRLRLTGITDARVSDRAFSFEELVKEFELAPEEIEPIEAEAPAALLPMRQPGPGDGP